MTPITILFVLWYIYSFNCFGINDNNNIQTQRTATVVTQAPTNHPEQQQQLQQLFWSYVKYVDPFYYWKKYKLQQLDKKIQIFKTANSEKIEIIYHEREIDLTNKDIALLEKINTIDEFRRHKNSFLTTYMKAKWLLHAPGIDDAAGIQEIFNNKNDIVKELKKQNEQRRKLIIFMKNENNITDQEMNRFINEIDDFERQKRELQQQIESYDE